MTNLADIMCIILVLKYRRNATVIYGLRVTVAGDVDFSLARFRFVNFILHSNLNDYML